MRARLHIWERGPCVDFDRDVFELLEEAFGCGVCGGQPMTVTACRDRVELAPDIRGGVHVRRTAPEAPDPFRFYVNVVGDYVVRCSSFEIQLKVVDAGVPRRPAYLTAALPAPYLLPWPTYLREHGEAPYDRHAAVVREVRSRVQEIRRDGLEPSSHLRVPTTVQELLTAQERVRLFSEWTL